MAAPGQKQYGTDPNYRAVQAQQMRNHLVAAGYNVDRHGPITQRLMHAYTWYQHNQDGPHKGSRTWNSINARRPAGMAAPVRDPKVLHGPGNEHYPGVKGAPHDPVAKAHTRAKGRGGGGGGGGGYPAPSGPVADPSSFPGVPMPPQGGTNTAHMVGAGMADTLAGYQYDPQIHELLTQLEQGKRDTGQHQADIGHWYDQVQGAQHTAAGRDTEAAQHAHDVTTQALQGILQSLGGSRGAGVVGAAGLNDLAAQASAGSSQDRYNADLAPLLQQEEAGAHSREGAQASQIAAARDAQLVGLRGQRGQARSKAAMDILAANNQGRQTNFQNRLAVQNANLAASSLGLNADQTYAGIAAQKANTKLNAQKLKLESLSFQQKSGAPNWAKLNYPDRQTVVHDAVARAVATMAPDHWDADFVKDRAFKLLRAGGYGSARGRKQGRGRSNPQSRRQIQAAVDAAVEAAYQARHSQQPQQ